MTTLIVQLPSRDPALQQTEWRLPDMAFLLVDKRGRTMRTGRAALALLPTAQATVLMLSARDVLLLAAPLPPVKGPKLRQALPNIVEDRLIQDPQNCHVAVDPASPGGGMARLAVVDRAWFRFLLDAFVNAGHRNVRAVPLAVCLPVHEPVALAAGDALADVPAAVSAEPMVAAILGAPPQPLSDLTLPLSAPPRLELAIIHGMHAEGLIVLADALRPTLAALAGDAPVELYKLVDVPGTEPILGTVEGDLAPARPLPFEALARNAQVSRFDLCQFEFARQPWGLSRESLYRLRLPLALVAAALLVAIIGENVEWLKLSRQRDALVAEQTELLLGAFPRTSAVLDPPSQMTREVDRLRTAAGELSPNDFLSLAEGLGRSLGGVPPNAIASLDYRERALEVAFKPGAKPDAGFESRLARNGLSSQSFNGKWTIKSSQ